MGINGRRLNVGVQMLTMGVKTPFSILDLATNDGFTTYEWSSIVSNALEKEEENAAFLFLFFLEEEKEEGGIQ